MRGQENLLIFSELDNFLGFIVHINAMNKISSGSKVLDNLLEGGFESGIISTIYGASGTGKSNIAMLISLNVASQGKKIVFIDTEGGFSTERVSQLHPKDYKKILKNIIILNPTTFEEQGKCFKDLEELITKEKIGLSVVDSIIMLYRLQKGIDEISKTNKELAKQLFMLTKIARKKEIPVVVTNQVYSEFGTNNVHMVGGDLLKYWSKTIVKLETLESGTRKGSIFKHRSLPSNKKIYFIIENSGLREIEAKEEDKKGFNLF